MLGHVCMYVCMYVCMCICACACCMEYGAVISDFLHEGLGAAGSESECVVDAARGRQSTSPSPDMTDMHTRGVRNEGTPCRRSQGKRGVATPRKETDMTAPVTSDELAVLRWPARAQLACWHRIALQIPSVEDWKIH
jgi:hypothetical protein